MFLFYSQCAWSLADPSTAQDLTFAGGQPVPFKILGLTDRLSQVFTKELVQQGTQSGHQKSSAPSVGLQQLTKRCR